MPPKMRVKASARAMTRYIVRPKRLKASAAVSFASIKVDAKSRQQQLQSIHEYRKNDPVERELQRWIDEEKGRSVHCLSEIEKYTSVTGTTLLDMDAGMVQRLEKEVEGLKILIDQPIDLIRPEKTATLAGNPTKKDLWHLDAIGLTKARKAGFKGTGKGITVAVLDTGIDPNHPELHNRVAGAVTFDVDSWTANPLIPSIDTKEHGTHVAGLICGKKVGVAPEAQVLNGVMIPNGFGNLSDFILALEWSAAQNEVSIVNMSAGIRGFIEGMEDVIEDLLAVGVLPIIATGNEGRGRTRSPGNYNPVLSVGASDRDGGIASFSSSGTHMVNNSVFTVPDLVAPGKDITSCVPGGGYETWDGTSMATPIVSGVAALIIEKYPEIHVLDLMELILETCKDLGHPSDRQGRGLVQVQAALNPASKTSKNPKKKAKRTPKKKAAKKNKARRR